MDNLERAVAVLAIAPWILLAATAKRIPPVSVEVTPRVGLAPLDVTLSVHVTPDPDVRIVEWVFDCDSGYYARRQYSITGQLLPTYQVPLRRVPPGRCRSAGFITDRDAKTTTSALIDSCYAGPDVHCGGEGEN